MELSDRVAVVTGASSGIGEATARALAGAGCKVVLAARRTDRLDTLADELGREQTLVAPTDVTETDAVERMVDATLDAFGGIDVLVNNAGIGGGGRVAEADLPDLHRTVDVNLQGVITTTHAVLPSLLKDGGDIVTVSSLHARHPAAGVSAYAASKSGVNGFCRSLRKEMADEDVRVSIVMPGPVVTELNDWAWWDGRAMDPEDIAAATEFVLSRPRHVEIPDITVNSTDKFD